MLDRERTTMTKSMNKRMSAVCALGMLVSAGTAMAQQAWGPPPQSMYKQNYGSAPTFVSYGTPAPASVRLLSARPAAKSVVRSNTSRAVANTGVNTASRSHARTTYSRQSASGF